MRRRDGSSPRHAILEDQSVWRRNNWPGAQMQQQLGHSSIQVTVDVYGHLVPGANRAAVDRLDAAPVGNPGATKAPDAVQKADAK